MLAGEDAPACICSDILQGDRQPDWACDACCAALSSEHVSCSSTRTKAHAEYWSGRSAQTWPWRGEGQAACCVTSLQQLASLTSKHTGHSRCLPSSSSSGASSFTGSSCTPGYIRPFAERRAPWGPPSLAARSLVWRRTLQAQSALLVDSGHRQHSLMDTGSPIQYICLSSPLKSALQSSHSCGDRLRVIKKAVVQAM